MRHHTYSRGRTLSRTPSGDPPAMAPDRKALQLCHQVAVTLQEVLADCGDPLLQSLTVLEVEPAPDASRLLVTVASNEPSGPDAGLERLHEHLGRASGHLRSEVASAITRKRAPVLVYRLAAAVT